ncbi:hypothetical protein DER44DRAFT_789237 [Fusarium oxysporum]|nr:hypothetical protein DER44DRAFT_789237 [Fusarium oxysporum]
MSPRALGFWLWVIPSHLIFSLLSISTLPIQRMVASLARGCQEQKNFLLEPNDKWRLRLSLGGRGAIHLHLSRNEMCTRDPVTRALALPDCRLPLTGKDVMIPRPC